MAMNRRSFLKLFSAAPTAIVAPKFFFAPRGGWISPGMIRLSDLVNVTVTLEPIPPMLGMAFLVGELKRLDTQLTMSALGLCDRPGRSISYNDNPFLPADFIEESSDYRKFMMGSWDTTMEREAETQRELKDRLKHQRPSSEDFPEFGKQRDIRCQD